MADSKDEKPDFDINRAIAKSRLTKETVPTPGMGARVLQKRHVPQPPNDKGDDATPPTGKGR